MITSRQQAAARVGLTQRSGSLKPTCDGDEPEPLVEAVGVGPARLEVSCTR